MKIKNEIEKSSSVAVLFTPCFVVLLFIQEPCDNVLFLRCSFFWLFHDSPLPLFLCRRVNAKHIILDPFVKHTLWISSLWILGSRRIWQNFLLISLLKLKKCLQNWLVPEHWCFFEICTDLPNFNYSLLFVFKEKYRQKFVWRCNYKQCCVLGRYCTCSLLFWNLNVYFSLNKLLIFECLLTRIVNTLVRLLKSFILWGAKWLIWRTFM